MELLEFVQYYKVPLTANNNAALWKVDSSLINAGSEKPLIKGLHTIIIVISGEIKISLQNKVLSLGQNSLADIIHDNSYTLLSATENLHAYMLVMTKEYMDRLTSGGIPATVDYVLNIKKEPLIPVKPEHISIFLKELFDIKRTFENTEHLFLTHVLRFQIWIFLAEIANYQSEEKEVQRKKVMRPTDRQKTLYLQFMKILPLYIEKEHSVDFYASTLCVTPQYLGRIVRNMSDRTIHFWINETLINEIGRRLAETDMSIQQIADELNFSEQATMTKFFKKHKGVSPLRYRQQIIEDEYNNHLNVH